MPNKMRLSWEALEAACLRFAPEGSTRRKMLQLLSVILLFEGVSVLILFSYDSAMVGVFSIAAGLLILLLFYPERRETPVPQYRRTVPKRTPPGLVLMDRLTSLIGDVHVYAAFGALLVVGVLVYNFRFSPNPKLGDFDTLSMLFGAMLIAYPFTSKRYKVESAFCVLFLGIVVLLLVVPQAVTSISSRAGSSAGGFYVHYMLAEPFVKILGLLGIPASSQGANVTLTFLDGSVNVLSISAYCAGLYSFSIFVSAFISFVLIFERLPARMTAFVLAIGLVAAYAGNVLRMVIIGVVGYYRGLDALLWTHENVGWMIFLGWSSVFWFLVMRYASGRGEVTSDAA